MLNLESVLLLNKVVQVHYDTEYSLCFQLRDIISILKPDAKIAHPSYARGTMRDYPNEFTKIKGVNYSTSALGVRISLISLNTPALVI